MVFLAYFPYFETSNDKWVFTEPLPSNVRGCTYRLTEMKYATEMGSGVMTYTPGFTKFGSPIQKIIEGGDTQVQWRSHFNFEPTSLILEK
jgi:hypothetical protein